MVLVSVIYYPIVKMPTFDFITKETLECSKDVIKQ